MNDQELKTNNPYIGKSLVELIALRSTVEDDLHAYPYPFNDVADTLRSKLRLIDFAASIAIATQNFS